MQRLPVHVILLMGVDNDHLIRTDQGFSVNPGNFTRLQADIAYHDGMLANRAGNCGFCVHVM